MDRIANREPTSVGDTSLDEMSGALLPGAGVPAPTVVDVLVCLAERKFFIFKSVLVSALVALAIAFCWPSRYTAVARIMPPQQSQNSIASALLGQLGQLGQLAAFAGGSIGSKSASEIYVYILESRSLADDLVDQFSLMKVYKDKKRVDARKDLASHTLVKITNEGGISIAVTDRDPQRAANIANAYVEGLKKLTQTLAVTEAGRRRIFFEHEVQLAGDDLAKAELDLKKTQERTGILMLEPQAKSVLEGLASLQAQIAVKEAQVQSMRSFATDENPDLERAQSELAAMKNELTRLQSGRVGSSIADMDVSKIPEKGIEYFRAYRELRYREAVFDAMTKQFEIARLDEAKDAAVIQFLDKALPPEERSSPQRGLILLTVTTLAFFMAGLVAIWTERTNADRSLSSALQLLKQKAFEGFQKPRFRQLGRR